MADLSIVIEEKKYMWDNAECADKGEAEGKAAEYSKKGFETRIISIAGKFLVYTRRVVEEKR